MSTKLLTIVTAVGLVAVLVYKVISKDKTSEDEDKRKLSLLTEKNKPTDESTTSRGQSSGSSKKSLGHLRETDQQVISAVRSWEMTSFGKAMSNHNGGKYPGFFFTIMSYNVLAQDLIDEHQYLYKEHVKDALVWEVRWSNLLTEIKQFDPDILCLQEVQGSHIEKYYNKFTELGYSGVYKQRTGIRTDGCAIYFKTDVLKLNEHTTVEFNQPNTNVLNRDNVAIIAKLSPISNPDKQFVVATTHLLYNPRRQDVRLAQTQLFLAEIDRIAFKRDNVSSRDLQIYHPVILTGDLNSNPQSAVYEFITRGYLQYEDLDQRTLQRSNSIKTGKMLVPNFLGITDQCQHETLVARRTQNANLKLEDELRLINLQHFERKVSPDMGKRPANKSLFSSGILTHNLAFKSVYKHFINSDREGTTYQDEWVTVDYIFYSGLKSSNNGIKEDKLKLLARYKLPMKSQLNNVRIPNFALGSDHLPLVAKFKLEF